MAAADGRAAAGIMVLGGWLCGVGVGIVSTSVPLPAWLLVCGLYTEASAHQVWFISLVFRLGYGMTYWTSPAGKDWGWRVSILIQLMPAFIFIVGLSRLPDTYVHPP